MHGASFLTRRVCLRLDEQPGKVNVRAGEKTVTAFHPSPEFDRTFLHPLITPLGVEISRGVPPRPDEDQDHAWHRGLWYAHGDMGGADFWCEKTDKVTGRKTTARMVAAGAPKIDAAAAELTCKIDLVAANGKTIGTCWERFKFSEGRERLIDASIVLAAD